jgi:vancomycin permeability regulator SanA
MREEAPTDWDRNITFGLSVAVILATGGLGLLYAIWHVCRVARSAPHDVDSGGPVLVMGARLDGDHASPEFEVRMSRALRIFRNRTIILLGGRPGMSALSEAAVGRDWLVRRGIPKQAIVVEEGSNHTLENLREARVLLEATRAGEAVLISSRYHLARCGVLARALGIRHRLCGAEDKFTIRLNGVPRLVLEAFFIHWFFVGRLWAGLIGSTRMLDRVR